ncbi:5-oxoprolinase subunit PxpB [Amphibacillus cookii]|uniref:5-oxoprolinase subunit PxpB n=1 Tax=Amphibacillus cookii TaxID=767787 RepID=UPI00195A81F8|nr:5-oxoprolinase subunit PxpB [Amphibacillus cookii]MBM7542666.1 inhibitor of KinA [Amphibacillus cookii]
MKSRIVPFGDHGLQIQFEEKVDPEINGRVHQAAALIMSSGTQGIKEVIPAFRTLTVLYEPLEIDFQTLSYQLKPLIDNVGRVHRQTKRIVEIPVCYDKAFGLDLAAIAAFTKLSIAEIINRHSQHNYLIYMLGFLPGFAYLGGLDPTIAMPRLEEPRIKIPAGSVGIAGQQTGIYPLASPGGWRLIGATPVKLFNPKQSPPVLYQPGDYIRFKPIDRSTYEVVANQVEAGTYRLLINEVRE